MWWWSVEKVWTLIFKYGNVTKLVIEVRYFIKCISQFSYLQESYVDYSCRKSIEQMQYYFFKTNRAMFYAICRHGPHESNAKSFFCLFCFTRSSKSCVRILISFKFQDTWQTCFWSLTIFFIFNEFLSSFFFINHLHFILSFHHDWSSTSFMQF